jgi:hypothetical protein
MPNFETIVRCGQGHLFETIWVPLASFKAVRLGSRRLQRCPVGHHWSRVERVDPSTLTPEELAEARAHHDLRIP